MSLTYDEIDNILIDIFTGQRYVFIDDHIFLFKFPDNNIKQFGTVVYDRSYENALSEGLLPLRQLEKLVIERNVFTELDKKMIKKLEGQLEAQEVLLAKTTRVKANQERIKHAISKLKHEKAVLEYKLQSKLLMSAENKAEEDRMFYICSRCVFTESGELYWKEHKDALSDIDLELRDKILLEYIKFNRGFNARVIRES